MHRKIQISIMLILLGIPNVLYAQFTFQKTYTTIGGASGLPGCYTSNGNYVFAGGSFATGLEGVYLIRINEFGDTIWTKKYETTGLITYPTCITETIDKKLIIAGGAYYSGSSSDAFIMTVDSLGSLIWVKLFNNSSASGSDDYANGVISLPDSGCILFGLCRATIGFAGDAAFVIKLDKNGNTTWNKSYQYAYEIEGKDIQQTSDGGYIICGLHESAGVGAGKFYLLKINNIGTVMWSKIIEGTAPSFGEADGVRQTSDGGYIVAGKDEGSNYVFLFKTDSLGNFSWMKTYDTPMPDYVYSLEIAKDSGYVMVGRTGHLGDADYFIIKTNALGDTLWTNQYGTSANEVAYFSHQTADNGFVIGGYSNNSIYVVKTDSLGNSACNMPNITFNVNNKIASASVASVAPVVLNWATSIPSMIISTGGSLTTLCSTVSTDEIAPANLFILFPNPSTGSFEIKLNQNFREGKIELFNIIGDMIYSEIRNYQSKREIYFDNISSGIYFVTVFDGENFFSQKLIIE